MKTFVLSFFIVTQNGKCANLRPREFPEIEFARKLYRAKISDFTVDGSSIYISCYKIDWLALVSLLNKQMTCAHIHHFKVYYMNSDIQYVLTASELSIKVSDSS